MPESRIQIVEAAEKTIDLDGFDVCIDRLVGMQFQPPLRGISRSLVDAVNEANGIKVRVAVDLPSGLSGDVSDSCFRADVTFATGILKDPLSR